MRPLWISTLLLPLVTGGAAAQGTPGPPEVRATLVRSIGLDADSLFFDHIGWLTLRHTGELVVPEPRIATVRVIDPGTLETTRLGRSGAGPGEYRSPWVAGRIERNLWIWDPALRRMTVYDSALEVVTTLRFDMSNGPVGVLSAGAFVLPFRAGRRESAVDLLVLGPDGETVREEIPLGAGRPRFEIRSGSVTRTVFQPWSDETLWAASPVGAGFVVVDRRASGPPILSVRWYGPGGSLEWAREVPYTPEPISGRDVEHQARFMSEAMIGFAEEKGIPIDRSLFSERAVARSLHVPDRFPPATAVIVAASGEIVLRRTERPGVEHVDFWIVDRGRIRAVRLPVHFRLLYADGANLWGVQHAVDGREHIVHYRLEEPAGPGAQ